MDYSRNTKYFKSSDTLFYVGLPILVIGAIFVLLGWFFYIYMFDYQLMIGLVMAIGGMLLAFVPRWTRANEEDLEGIAASLKKDYGDATAARFGFATGISATSVATVIGGFDFEGEGILAKKGRTDGKYRSSVYTFGAFLISSKGELFAAKKSVSLVESSETEETYEIALSSIDGAEVRCETKALHGESVKCHRLVITVDGKDVISLPAASSAMLDSFCETIMREAKAAS